VGEAGDWREPTPALALKAYAALGGSFLFVVHRPHCAKITPTRRHVWSKSWQPAWVGGRVMTYDADAITELELERLRSKRQRYSERMCTSQAVIPAIKMIIGD
jgi:hypothetical protein